MHQWDVRSTRNLIFKQAGKAQLQLASPPLRSMIDRQEYVRYHYFALRTLVQDFVATQLKDRDLIIAVFSGDDDSTDAHQRFHTEVGAHALGCIQGLHSVADIAAHAVYYSLSLNLLPAPLRERAINLQSVHSVLSTQPALSQIATLLRSIEDGEFPHVAALANHGKHRSVVSPGFYEDQTGTLVNKHWLQFPEFTFKGVPFPASETMPLLEREFDRINRNVVDLGVAIHAELLAREALYLPKASSGVTAQPD